MVIAQQPPSLKFLGDNAGFQAANAESSNFLGYQAGRNAINAYQSNFMGYQAGLPTGAFDSNFFGLLLVANK
jgi:hypothetical protein